MSAIRAVLAEVVGLFIDDGALALLIAIVVVIAVGVHVMRLASGTGIGIFLIAGTIAALIASVARAARRT